ncbi:MAG: hypothetical protein ABEJ28_05925 [Salinigranum sp.]
MSDLNDHVLEEASAEGETLLIADLVSLIERHHPLSEIGAPVDLLEEYVAALAEGDSRFEPETVREAVEERLVDSETWVAVDALYPVAEGRVSVYPRRWHEQLDGEEDLLRIIEVVVDDLPEGGRETWATGGPGPGIPKDKLVEMGELFGGLQLTEIRDQFRELKDAGEINMSVNAKRHEHIVPTE